MEAPHSRVGGAAQQDAGRERARCNVQAPACLPACAAKGLLDCERPQRAWGHHQEPVALCTRYPHPLHTHTTRRMHPTPTPLQYQLNTPGPSGGLVGLRRLLLPLLLLLQLLLQQGRPQLDHERHDGRHVGQRLAAARVGRNDNVAAAQHVRRNKLLCGMGGGAGLVTDGMGGWVGGHTASTRRSSLLSAYHLPLPRTRIFTLHCTQSWNQ